MRSSTDLFLHDSTARVRDALAEGDGMSRLEIKEATGLGSREMDQAFGVLMRGGHLETLHGRGMTLYRWRDVAAAVLIAVMVIGCSAGTPTLIRKTSVSRGTSDHIIVRGSCVEPELVAYWTSMALPVLLANSVDQGYLSRRDIIKAWPQERLGLHVCLVSEPQPCCLGGTPCAPPYSEHGWARKAGCAAPNHVWVSMTWPGRCTEEWPDEPHCGDRTPDYDWRLTLVHELGNVLRLRWWIGDEGYGDGWVSRYYGPGGPVARTKKYIAGLDG